MLIWFKRHRKNAESSRSERFIACNICGNFLIHFEKGQFSLLNIHTWISIWNFNLFVTTPRSFVTICIVDHAPWDQRIRGSTGLVWIKYVLGVILHWKWFLVEGGDRILLLGHILTNHAHKFIWNWYSIFSWIVKFAFWSKIDRFKTLLNKPRPQT